jgi:hypothetical protein
MIDYWIQDNENVNQNGIVSPAVVQPEEYNIC